MDNACSSFCSHPSAGEASHDFARASQPIARPRENVARKRKSYIASSRPNSVTSANWILFSSADPRLCSRYCEFCCSTTLAFSKLSISSAPYPISPKIAGVCPRPNMLHRRIFSGRAIENEPPDAAVRHFALFLALKSSRNCDFPRTCASAQFKPAQDRARRNIHWPAPRQDFFRAPLLEYSSTLSVRLSTAFTARFVAQS